jgi:hypothetical protein
MVILSAAKDLNSSLAVLPQDDSFLFLKFLRIKDEKPFQNLFFVILNEVKDLNLLKIRDSSLRSE